MPFKLGMDASYPGCRWRWFCGILPALAVGAAEGPGDKMVAAQFAAETARLELPAYADVRTAADWDRRKAEDREKLRDMLGLLPWPEKTDLKPTVTGVLDHPEFTVEKLHFQSRPGLYVTANLYVPKQRVGKLPAILYVCGHARVVEGNVSMGNKTGYQHHGAWFARHGYVCLMIDTIQLGEIEGLHHGTRREGMWWWNARGYTPAGVEAWNGIRALDYLQSRPEVDGAKIGMTGRSGGGAYTWYTAALDERVKVAVPVAGITDLHNHVVDGVVAGHCDCMYWVNTYRWDFARLAGLLAPRPLLIANTDKDTIFPLDGVVRVHRQVAGLYRTLKAADKLGLLITEGPHKDTQDLQVPAFRWFNRFLKGTDPLITVAAEKLFKPADLRVLGGKPADEWTTKAHEHFVAQAVPAVPADAAAWARQRDAWLATLQAKSFGGWPAASPAGAPARAVPVAADGLTLTVRDVPSQEAVALSLWLVTGPKTTAATPVRLQVLDEAGWRALQAAAPKAWQPYLIGGDAAVTAPPAPEAVAQVRAWLEQAAAGERSVGFFAPRGFGPTAWGGTASVRNEILRRYMLLGQTLEGMRVWDIRRAVETVRQPDVLGAGARITLAGAGTQAVNALYASLFTAPVAEVELTAPPASHRTGPDYLNVLRHLDVPQAVALAAERQPVTIRQGNADDWSWAKTTGLRAGWPADRLRW